MDADTIYRRRWLILSVTCLSLVLVVVSVSSLNVALPTMQRQLSATGAELQWIIDSYGLVFAGLLLPAGALGDRSDASARSNSDSSSSASRPASAPSPRAPPP